MSLCLSSTSLNSYSNFINFSFSFIKFWESSFLAASNSAYLCFSSCVREAKIYLRSSNFLVISTGDWVKLNVTESWPEDWWDFCGFGFEKWEELFAGIWLKDYSAPLLEWLFDKDRWVLSMKFSINPWSYSQIASIYFFHVFWLAFKTLLSS